MRRRIIIMRNAEIKFKISKLQTKREVEDHKRKTRKEGTISIQNPNIPILGNILCIFAYT